MTTPKKEKTDPMDIDVLIDKVAKLPVPDIEKADLLKQFKENLMHPDHGEIENLNRIQNKYTSPNLLSPSQFLPPINPAFNQMSGQMPIQMLPPPQQFPTDIMTTAHFEILRNKMDSIQLELVDLLRHVKDYTQRYMNATRQQDMEKIDAYINGLFEIDKKMKVAEEKAREFEALEDQEKEPETKQSAISRATNGIKNFLGSIGDNVAGITNLVSNTAKIANDTLSKKIIGGPTQKQPDKETSNSKNIVSVEDYIKSNMNEMEGTSTSQSTIENAKNTVISTNANNLNTLKPKQHLEDSSTTPEESSQEEITQAIDKLNKSINEDIENTVKDGENKIAETPPAATSPVATSPVQQGGASEKKLSNKIKLLKLKLTKNKLEKELKSHKTRKLTNIKNKHTMKGTKHRK
jgi:hypothetical protein